MDLSKMCCNYKLLVVKLNLMGFFLNVFVAPNTKWVMYFIRKLVLCSLQEERLAMGREGRGSTSSLVAPRDLRHIISLVPPQRSP